jgi:hypothetical protein
MMRDSVQRDAAIGRGSMVTPGDATPARPGSPRAGGFARKAAPRRTAPYPRAMADIVRFRPGWRQTPWYLAVLAVVPASTHEGPITATTVLLAAVFAVTLGCVAAATRYGSGADLRPDALVLHGVRSRVVLWSNVGAVRTSSLLGTRVVHVVVDGRARLLRAPTHLPFLAPDKDFDAKVDALTEYWVAHRGAAWTPPARMQALTVQRTTS